MKPLSLLVLAQGFACVPPALLPLFEAQLSERAEPLDSVKEHEAQSVIQLVERLRAHQTSNPSYLEGFAFSFRIPQISSEFDLLKVTEGHVVNIELKIEDVGTARIEHQLQRNRYYLAPLEREMHTFTYVARTDTLYELGPNDRFGVASFERLTTLLDALDAPYEDRLENLFKVSNYLVSPINDTDRFLEGSYFLTNHQAQIKASFAKDCVQSDGRQPVVYLVYGSTGTGKSLLLYDLARSRCVPGQVCIIHCGLLSEGHELLNERQDAFRVISAKGIERVSLESYQGILVDEAQHLWPSQLRRIAELAVNHNLPLYLSMARRRLSSHDGEDQDVEQLLRALWPETRSWKLSHKIRTNRELVNFLLVLFEARDRPKTLRTSSVKISYATTREGLRELVDAYRGEEYQYLSYGAVDGGAWDDLVIEGCPQVSAVVGQEFDRVAMVAGPAFGREEEALYRQLLLQGLTCARDQIALIVYRNEELLARLLASLDCARG